MSTIQRCLLLIALFGTFPITAAAAQTAVLPREAQLGPRPFYLVDKMKDGPLKTVLGACTGPFHRTDFSFGHRGASLQFPGLDLIVWSLERDGPLDHGGGSFTARSSRRSTATQIS
jgi:hypothetical protein